MGTLLEREDLHGKTDVFRDRSDAGGVLARMLEPLSLRDPVLLAIPAGGVPVAVAMQRMLHAPLDLAVVSKITLPWNREAGFGAVAFDGSVLLNEELIREVMLSPADVETGIKNTRSKVERRSSRLRRAQEPLSLRDKSAVLVDDGLASGFTMLAAVNACRALAPAFLAIAVPTGHTRAISRVIDQVDLVACANVRGGTSYAVADAYEHWRDVLDAEVELMLERAQSPQ